ncbi:MAG: cysteine-rich CWC family protein [Planctomycetaceae bacterium]|nr:cysteine-rich CWC family protein [Planctomycetaceae bacterium]
MNTTSGPCGGASQCPACGGAFVCRIRAGYSTCWCFELPRVCQVDPDAECLCPSCLERRIADVSAASTVGENLFDPTVPTP